MPDDAVVVDPENELEHLRAENAELRMRAVEQIAMIAQLQGELHAAKALADQHAARIEELVTRHAQETAHLKTKTRNACQAFERLLGFVGEFQSTGEKARRLAESFREAFQEY